MSASDVGPSWAEHRKAAADAHASALAQKEARESARARTMLADFVVQARATGLPAVPLVVQGYVGK